MILLIWGPLAGAATAGDEPPVLLVLGDSLSAAHGFDQRRGWVALLAQRLNEQGLTHRVINASVSGETSRGGRQRLPALLARWRPAVVIIELGANDGLRGLPLAEMRDNLADMLRRARASGARVLLVGMRLPPNYGPAYTHAFHEVYVQLAQENGVPLVPFLLAGVSEQRELMQADNLHPTAEAQPRLLETLWPRLAPLLREGQESRPVVE